MQLARSYQTVPNTEPPKIIVVTSETPMDQTLILELARRGDDLARRRDNKTTAEIIKSAQRQERHHRATKGETDATETGTMGGFP